MRPVDYYEKFIASGKGTCVCGSKLEFRGLGIGFREFCSRSCSNAANFKGKIRKGARSRPAKDLWGDCECCGCCYQKINGRQKVCKACVPDAVAGGIYNRYRLSKAQYDALVEKQQGKCALCDAPFAVIDHNHETGRVRGLLCYSCNCLIGAFDQPADWFKRAQEYSKS